MFCIHCGAPNPEGAFFCSTCGKEIGTSANPPTPAETPQYVVGNAEKSPRIAAGQISPPISLTAQPPQQPQVQYLPAPQGKGKPVLWILCGFVACLLILMTVALGFRLNQASPATNTPPANTASDTPLSTAPATYATPATAPAPDNSPAPASPPVQPPPSPPPVASQNSIVGDWKTTTIVGSSIVLHFGADGRYTLKDVLDSEEGVYVFSSGDGTLRLQPSAVFSHDIVIWNCQLSGDSLSCVDPQGAGHVYTRFQR